MSMTAATHVRPGAKTATELSEKAIRDAKPGDLLRDTVVRGLQVRCYQSHKAFLFYYRTKGGAERRPKLGDWGAITISQARAAARGMLGVIAAGGDPSRVFAEARAEHTVEDLWDEWRKRRGLKKKPGSADEDKRLWEKKCGSLAKMKLSEVTFEVAADLHERISKVAPISANRTIALLKTMFHFAIAPLDWGITKNPFEGIDMNKETKRRRYMTDSEAAAIYLLLEKERQRKDHLPSVVFLWLLILTGARKGEIAKARWDQLMGDALVLSEHKTDQNGEDRIIMLSPAALEILKWLPKTNGTLTGVADPKKLWAKIRTDAKCPDLRIHDLRHSFASMGLSHAKLTLGEIRELLGHSQVSTTGRYAHLQKEAARASVAAISDQIFERMRPRTEVQLPQTQSIQ